MISGIGFSELLFIAALALLVFGPDKLPGVIRSTAAYIRQFKRTLHDVKSEVTRELDLDNIQSDFKATKDDTQQLLGFDELQESLQELRKNSETLAEFDEDGFEYADSTQDKTIYDDVDINDIIENKGSSAYNATLPDPNEQASTGVEPELPTQANSSPKD